MEKQEKVGMTKIEWGLCIIGIIILLSFILLPPIFRAFSKGETGQTGTNSSNPTAEETPITIITCQKNENSVETEYILNSKANALQMIAQTAIYSYPEITEDILTSCQNNLSLYQNIPGFYYNCHVTENQMIVESRVQLEAYQGEDIPIYLNLKADANTLKSTLLGDGFQCETRDQQ